MRAQNSRLVAVDDISPLFRFNLVRRRPYHVGKLARMVGQKMKRHPVAALGADPSDQYEGFIVKHLHANRPIDRISYLRHTFAFQRRRLVRNGLAAIPHSNRKIR